MSDSPIQSAQAMRQPGTIVYLAGVATSALVLWGVNVALQHDVNILGWYVNAILPVGALMIGIASGSGYALASYHFNVKLSKPFVLGMITTGLLDWGAAQYLNYSSLLEQYHASADAYPFLKFLQDQCEQMTMNFSRSSSGSPTELGMFGYLFKALEIAGFAGGTMIPSALLFAMPYCRRCQLYLKKHHVGYIPSSMTRKQLFDTPRKERKAALENLVAELAAQGLDVAKSVEAVTLEETTTIVRGLAAGTTKEAAAHAVVMLKKCPRCDGHHVNVTLNHVTLDRKQASRKLVDIDKTEAVAARASA